MSSGAFLSSLYMRAYASIWLISQYACPMAALTALYALPRACRAGLGPQVDRVAVLMGHASSAYALGLCAAYVPGAGIGIGRRYMGFLRAAV